MTGKVVNATTVEGLIRSAFAAGAVTQYRVGKGGALSVDASMHGRCLNPIEVSRGSVDIGTAGQAVVRQSSDHERRAFNVTLRCRHCSACLHARAKYWREAATREMAQATLVGARTWFGTLTLSPEHQAFAAYGAMASIGVQKFNKLSAVEQLPLRNAAVNRSFTLAFKRLRKAVGPRGFRYVLVCEAHKSGLPHYHMLLHETAQSLPIRKSALNDFWQLGFSQWRLAKPEAASYVAKYLSKAALARVRASLHYGSWVHRTIGLDLGNPPDYQKPALAGIGGPGEVSSPGTPIQEGLSDGKE